MRRLTRTAKAAGAALLLSSGICFVQTLAPLPWPPEFPKALLPGASLDFSEKSNVVLSTISPAVVHHRENPQFIYDGRADVAPMYYHFGDYLKTRLPRDFDYVPLPNVPLPTEGNFRDTLAISTIRNARHKAAAAAWVEFIRSDAAATVYIRHGFDYSSNEERTRIVRGK